MTMREVVSSRKRFLAMEKPSFCLKNAHGWDRETVVSQPCR
jgi:hypothetical protein